MQYDTPEKVKFIEENFNSSCRWYRKSMLLEEGETKRHQIDLACGSLFPSFEAALKYALVQCNKKSGMQLVQGRDLNNRDLLSLVNQLTRLSRQYKDKLDPLPLPDDELKQICSSANLLNNVVKHEGKHSDNSMFPRTFSLIRQFIQGICPNVNLDHEFTDNNRFNEHMKKNGYFSHSEHDYILVVDSLDALSLEQRKSIATIKWALVIDFDPTSEDEDGLAFAYQQLTGNVERKLDPRQPERTEFDLYTTVPYWFFASGYSVLSETVPKSKREWSRCYGTKLRDVFENYHRSFGNKVEVVLLSSQQDKVTATVDAIDSIYKDNARYMLLSKLDPEVCNGLTYVCFPLIPELFAFELQKHGHKQHTIRSGCWMPSQNGSDILVAKEDEFSHLELVHRDIAETEPEDKKQERLNFLQGYKTLSWYAAKQNFAIRRPAAFNALNNAINSIHGEDGGQSLIILRHAPGCGGTTFLRDFAYRKKEDYPVCNLRQYSSRTINQLQRLYGILGKKLLLFVDYTVLNIGDVKILLHDILRHNVPAIIIYSTRSSQRSTHSNSEIVLNDIMDPGEFDAMCEKLTPWITPERQDHVRVLRPERSNPFIMSLTAFETQYAGLSPFIATLLQDMAPEQKKIVLQLAIADKYARRPLPAFFYEQPLLSDGYDTPTLGGSNNIFSSLVVMEALFGAQPVYRLRHPLFADEIVSQLLFRHNGAELQDEAKAHNMTETLLELIDQSRGKSTIPLEQIVTVLQNLFIERDDGDTDKEYKRFSPIIEYLRNIGNDSSNRVGRIFKKLVEVYPESPHFLAHLSRFYSIIEENYEQGIEYAKKAVEQGKYNKNTKDPVLYHIYGMSYVRRINNLYAPKALNAFRNRDNFTRDQLMENIHSDVDSALEAFAISRSGQDKIPSYYATINLCLDVLDLAKKVSGYDDVNAFLRANTDTWSLNCLDIAQSLIIEYRAIENATRNEANIQYNILETKLKTWSGDFQAAVDLWSHHLKYACDIEKPRVRRFLARSIQGLAESRKAFAEQDIEQIMSLMEANMHNELEPADIRLWFNVIRYSTDNNPEQLLDQALSKLSAWSASAPQCLEALYYYYILTCIKAIEGSMRDESRIPELEKRLKELARSRPDGRTNFEWLGQGNGIGRLKKFQSVDLRNNPALLDDELERLIGVIDVIKNPSSGLIRCHEMNVFFNPANTKEHPSQSDTRRVSFALGFSYDGPRAYDQSVAFVPVDSVMPATALPKPPQQPLKSGDQVKCRVTKNIDYYVRVHLMDYCPSEGSIHISQLGDCYNADSRPREGDILNAKILSLKTFENGRTVWLLTLSENTAMTASKNNGFFPFENLDFGKIGEK